jgi:type IV pilus assembly protein PilA
MSNNPETPAIWPGDCISGVDPKGRSAMRRRGFTLIEIMVVVAIVGLLGALSINAFLRFVTRARQAEARTNLKAIYTAQMSIYGSSQSYNDELSVIGFEPEMNNRYAYFGGGGGTELRPCAAPPATANGPSAICPNSPEGTGTIENDEKWSGCAPAAPAYAAPPVSGTAVGPSGVPPVGAIGAFPLGTCCPQGLCEFAAGAAGNVDNDPTIDEWLISSQSSTAVGADTCVGGQTGVFAEGEPVSLCDDAAF